MRRAASRHPLPPRLAVSSLLEATIPLVLPTPVEDLALRGPDLDVVLLRTGPVVGPPTVLVPGLAASPVPFALHARRSLGATLAASGRTPWLVDFQVHWRGSGQDATRLLQALDQALDALAAHAGVDRHAIDAVGHSLGGILLLGLLVQGRPLRRVVTLASALDYRLGRAPLPRLLSLAPKGLRPIRLHLRRGGVPVTRLAQVGAPLFGRGLDLPLQRDQFHPGSTPGEVVRLMMQAGVRDMPLALLMQLADLFTEEGLRLGPDQPALKDAVERLPGPVLYVAARQDRQCPLDAVRDAAARTPRGRLLEVGGDGAPGEGYGHVDLMTGSRAPEEVFDPIVAFLDEETPR